MIRIRDLFERPLPVVRLPAGVDPRDPVRRDDEIEREWRRRVARRENERKQETA